MAEAVAQFQKGLNQLGLLQDNRERKRQELELRSGLGDALLYIKGYAALETGQTLARARELWEQLGSPSEFLHASYRQSVYHLYRGEPQLALRLDEDLLRLSRQRNDSAGIVLGHLSAGRDLFFVGRFASSQFHLEDGRALHDPISHRSVGYQVSGYLAFLGNVLFCLGFPDQALEQSCEAIAEARRLAHLPTLAGNLATGIRLRLLVGDNAALRQLVEQLGVVATEHGFPQWRPMLTICRGWVKVKNGDVAQGISLLRSGLAASHGAWRPHNIALLAAAYEIAGQIEEGLDLFNEALQIGDMTGERWFLAELHRHKGQLLLRQGHAEAAEELYRKALSIAKEQEAKLWELRAAVSVGRLRRDQGRRPEARDILKPIYGWFTEGFATPDLKEAKALLDELT